MPFVSWCVGTVCTNAYYMPKRQLAKRQVPGNTRGVYDLLTLVHGRGGCLVLTEDTSAVSPAADRGIPITAEALGNVNCFHLTHPCNFKKSNRTFAFTLQLQGEPARPKLVGCLNRRNLYLEPIEAIRLIRTRA